MKRLVIELMRFVFDMPQSEADANRMRDVFNALHAQMQAQPFKNGYQLSVGGVLNAYREGDVSFEQALSIIERMIAREI